MKHIVMVTGGFDPIHPGHIDYLRDAAALGSMLVVGLNSDRWLKDKKGKCFMPWDDRRRILMELPYVDMVYDFDDTDGTAIDFINKVTHYFSANDEEKYFIFANGGDRDRSNVPEELGQYHTQNLAFVYDVGGSKSRSSSDYLNDWTDNTIARQWGNYTVLHEDDAVKVKELVIQPNKGISYQKHFLRSEIWFVSKGKCTVKHSHGKRTDFRMHNLREDDVFTVRANEWHQIWNPYSEPCHIIEIQYGSETDEEDILRDEYSVS